MHGKSTKKSTYEVKDPITADTPGKKRERRATGAVIVVLMLIATYILWSTLFISKPTNRPAEPSVTPKVFIVTGTITSVTGDILSLESETPVDPKTGTSQKQLRTVIITSDTNIVLVDKTQLSLDGSPLKFQLTQEHLAPGQIISVTTKQNAWGKLSVTAKNIEVRK